ncbi:MAG: amidase [Alphaproteobacteria bacterium]|nr:amidase [Alphaproteobacteria bacterium]
MAGALAAILGVTLGPVAGAQAAPPTPKFEVEEATIASVHAALAARQITCRQLVDAYLDRIAAYDKNGPGLNAIIRVNPEARAEADAQDARFAKEGLTRPLDCVPMIVKDNFETQGLATSDGDLAFKDYVPDTDATLVARVKAAGAIVLAKANMAEWAFSPVETVSSVLPGYTRNPYDTSRVTAGSSGGTAAAVAASLGLVGFGSDTGDSIRGPSSHDALVGIRSTMGLTSRAGIFPLSLRADIGGPMARNVADAVAVYQVIIGPDPRDPVTARAADHPMPNLARRLDPDGLKGKRIGVLHEAYDRASLDPEVAALFAAALDDLRRQGAIIVDPAPIEGYTPPSFPPPGQACEGFKYDLNAFLAARAGKVPKANLDAIIASGEFHPSVSERLKAADAAPVNPPGSPACLADEARRQALRAEVNKTLTDLKLDALVYPTWSNPPRLIGDLTTPAGDNNQIFSPFTGFPAIQVPMGYTRGDRLPAGLTFFGPAWSDPELITLAYAYEQATHHRRPPPSTPPLN